MEDQRIFQNEFLACSQASKLSRDGNYYAVVHSGDNFVIYQDKNPDVYDGEILVAVYKNDEKCDWDEIY